MTQSGEMANDELAQQFPLCYFMLVQWGWKRPFSFLLAYNLQ